LSQNLPENILSSLVKTISTFHVIKKTQTLHNYCRKLVGFPVLIIKYLIPQKTTWRIYSKEVLVKDIIGTTNSDKFREVMTI